jgi:hypothetical protein
MSFLFQSTIALCVHDLSSPLNEQFFKKRGHVFTHLHLCTQALNKEEKVWMAIFVRFGFFEGSEQFLVARRRERGSST